ncbi:MAG: hypothetical protein PVF51_14720 [Nitrospirota bacterium]
MDRASQVLRQDWDRQASVAERRAAAAVIDHNAPQITCPACGMTFATGPSECPDCGLGLI